MELNGQIYAPAALTLEMKPGTNYVEDLVGPREIWAVLEERKDLPFPGFESRSFQSVASPNTGYTVPVPH